MGKKILDDSSELAVKKRIVGISFGPLSQQEINGISELQVTSRELYNPTTRQPSPGGVLDRRLGISDKVAVCSTCGLKLIDCAGHFGHIPLVLPVFNVGFFKAIIQVLQCLCKCCGQVLLTEEQRQVHLAKLRRPNLEALQKMATVKGVYDACRKISICPHCTSRNGLVKKAGIMKVIHELNTTQHNNYGDYGKELVESPELKVHLSKAQEDLNPLQVYSLFSMMSDEDCELMGLGSRPEDFLWTSMPVPPACIRPSVAMTLEGGTNEDDLTVKLSEIVYTNLVLREALIKGSPAHMLVEDWDFLQLQCAMYVNSELSFLQLQGRPIRGICQRLKGKMGRFRGNLSGKRVDFSGRTVISPDPNLMVHEVGVPVYVAKLLTFPEHVTKYNIGWLRELVLNGPDVHPGANFVISANPQNIATEPTIKRYLKFGDRRRIAQELKPGDIVERHLCDGDVVLFNRQPSLHKLSIMAHLVRVRPWRTFRFNECACTPYNADFDGDEMNLHVPQTQEARAEALLLMGLPNNLVSPRNGQPLIGAIQDFITSAHLLTWRDVFLTKAQYMQLVSHFSRPAQGKLAIPPPTIFHPVPLWTGKQVIAQLLAPYPLVNLECKAKTFTGGSGNLQYSCPRDGFVVIYNGQLLLGTLDKSTVGGDSKNSIFYILLREYGPMAAVTCMSQLARLAARFLGNRGFSIGINDVQPSAKLTALKAELMSKGHSECQGIIEAFQQGQLALQAGCTAEQTLEASLSGVLSRIREDAGGACLAELPRDNAPLIMQWCGSKGSKINVSQMVACVGQQIISGQRIPDGFQGRSLPHFGVGEKSPAAKGFVQNSFYSGLTPTEFFFHAVSGREGLVDTAVKTAETGYMQRRLMKALEDLHTSYDGTVRTSIGSIVQFCYGDDGLDPSLMESEDFFANLGRLYLTVLHAYPVYEDGKTNHEERRQYCESKFPATVAKRINDFLDKQPPMLDTSAKIFMDIAAGKYVRCAMEPASAVGALGAQSIGEPGTQMTLKTFHFAGVASMNVTLGVPRLKEIINASRFISTPIITAPLVNEDSVAVARLVKGRLEQTRLGQLCDYMEEVYPLSTNQGYRPHLRVKIDMDLVSALQLEVTLEDIAASIERSKAPVRRIDIQPGENVLVIFPQDSKLPAAIKRQAAKKCLQNHEDLSPTYFCLQNLKRHLPQIGVVGIATINRAVISADGGRNCLLVEGYGMRQVMATPGIRGRDVTSNHVLEVEQVLGIEAARHTISHEINYTMGKHGMTIDSRHVSLLADLMTSKGQVLGITRHGIQRLKQEGVLMLASFEKTADHLFEAARFGKHDTLDGVSESIIMGMPMPIGTGHFKLVQQIPVSTGSWLQPRSLLFDRPEYHEVSAI